MRLGKTLIATQKLWRRRKKKNLTQNKLPLEEHQKAFSKICAVMRKVDQVMKDLSHSLESTP